jgi:hypothetical protein
LRKGNNQYGEPILNIEGKVPTAILIFIIE